MKVKVKDFFYKLFRGRYLQHWQHFFEIPQSYVRITLYLVHHGNKASKQEIIEQLTELGGDPRSPLTIERAIRYMKSEGILVEESLGVLSLKNPRRYSFIIKWVRGNVLDRWFALSIPSSILAIIFNFLEVPPISQFFMIITFIFIILSFVDDFLHQQYW